MKNALRPLSRLRSWLVARLLLALGFLWLGHGLADPYPPAWNGGAGAAVHYPPVAWPAENGWTAYTMQGADQKDAKTLDPSNGGTSPQNFVNVTSGCTDLNEPSIYYAYDAVNQVIFFRWRVQQQANTYATGPSAGSFASTDPWRSALWTVLIDVNGDGYRDFAVQLDGSSGSPAVPVDLLTSYYSTTLSQAINPSDPNTYVLDHNPSAFTSGSTILNFQESLTPVTTWPSGSSATVWDYGTTRSKRVPGAANTCGEFFIDYQIPLGLLDASAFGGPTITPNTPFAMLFATSNSLQNPLQKDVVYMGDFVGKDSEPGPFGDLITLNGTVRQPIVQSVTTAGCGNSTLAAKVIDSVTVVGGVIVSTIAGVDFYYYADTNGNGLADDGNSWTLAAVGSSSQISIWTATWNSTGLPKGQYLIGVQALDNVAYNKNPDGSPSGIAHRTFSYLSTVQLPANAPGEQNFANPAPAPGVVYATFVNTCGLEPPRVTKTVSASAVSVGATVTYTITVHNPGPAPVPLDSISDFLPVGFSYVATTGGTLSPTTTPTLGDTGTITWTFAPAASIPAAGTATLLFTANVGTVQGAYNNLASAVVDGNTLTSDPVQVTVGAPRLTMAKSASPASVSQGAPVTFTFTYSNDSPVDVTGVVIEDMIPHGASYRAGTLEINGAPQTDAADGDLAHYDAGAPARVLFTLGTIPAGEGPLTASFQVLVNNPYPPTAPVPLANTATIDGNETDPVNATSYTFVDVPRPYLTIQKSASTVLVAPGNPVVYTISYQNTGTATATGVTITDVIPPGFTFASATGGGTHSGGTVTWNIGNLAAGASASVTLTLAAGNPFTGTNPSTNTATIDSDQTNPVSDNAHVGVSVTGTACSTFYFRNTLANVGFDGTRRIADTTEVLPGDTGTGVQVTTPLNQAYIEAVRFYEEPSMPYDVEFAGTITTNFYIDRNAGVGITIRATVYNYNSTTGSKTVIGTSTTSFGGNQKGLLTYTLNATGTLSAGNRLLWVYEVKSDNNVQQAQILFQFGGTVANSVSGSGTTFANSRSSYCVIPPAVLVMDKQASLALAQPGDAIAYTIRFANTGVSHATGATVVDTLPAGLSFASATLNGNPVVPVISGQQLTFTVNSSDTVTTGRVSGGQSGTLVINATVDTPLAPGITSLLNTAVLDSDQIVPISDTTLTLVKAPALTVTKSASDTLLIAGETVTYTITVLNSGTGTATNVTINDDIPDQTYFEYVAASIAGGDSRSTSGAPVGALQWIVNSLAPGATATVTFQMRVRDTAPLAPDGLTTWANSASVSSGQTAAVTSDPATVTISTNPNLHIAKSVSAGPHEPGDTLTYTLLISNDGSSAATGVLIFDPIPAYTAYLNGTLAVDTVLQTDVHDGDFGWFDAVNNRIVLELGDLPPGASVAVDFQVAISGTLPAGTTAIANSATVSASNASAKNDTAAVEADAAPVLQLVKSGPGAIPYPAASVDGNYTNLTKFQVLDAANLPLGGVIRVNGQDRTVVGIVGLEVEVDAPVTVNHGDSVFSSIAYTLAYSNTGTAAATGVVLTDTLPAGYILHSVAPAQNSGPNPLQWNLGTLAAGDSGTVTVVIFPGGPGELTNTATLDSAETAPVGDSATTGVGGLLVTKATSTPLVYNGPGGSTATWTITVTNQRAVAAEGVSVTDLLEPGFSYASTTAITYGGGGGSRPVAVDPAPGATEPAWGNFTINGGGSVSITFVANIAPNAGVGVYQNYVEVTSSNLSVIPFNPLDTPDEDVEVDYLLVDLSLTKTPSTLTPDVGGTVTFTLALSNADGFDTATGIVVQDVLPTGYVYVPASIAPAADPNVTPDDSGYPATLAWTIASLPANTTVNLTYQAVVQPNGPGIVYVNKAQVVSADQYDADSTPNDNAGDDFSSVNLPPANPSTGTLQGTVYLDVDGNGLYTLGIDTPLAGVDVTVTDSLGGIHTLTTDHNGEYSVVVPAGDAVVDVDESTLPAGYTLTTNAYGQGSDPATVTVPAGGSADASTGYVDSTGSAGTVQGTIYLDVDRDGLYTPGTDTPLAGITVTVTDSNGGVYILATDLNGQYSVLVAAGDATVDVDNADLPAGYTLTTNANGQGSDPATVLVPAGGSANASTGYVDSTGAAGTVQGTIYLDVNGDGLYDPLTDTPLAGITVTVTDSNGGVYTLTTDDNGVYSVLVAAGNATVDVDDSTLPPGYTLTTNAYGQGSDPATVLVPAGGSANASTGYLDSTGSAGTVQGTIYLDVDGDGLYDPFTDTPLAGVIVTVTDSNGGVYTFTTDDNGVYSVLVAAGAATVDVADMPGYTLTTNANGQGSDPAAVLVPIGGSVDASTGYLYTSTLAKTVVSGSPAPIGGIVVYRLVLAIPPVTIHDVTVTDVLPADMSFVPGSVSVVGALGLTTGYVDEATSVDTTTTPGEVVFALGTVACTNPAPNNTVTIEFQARVDNVAGNLDGVVKTNSATARGAGMLESDDTADIAIHEPKVTIAKTWANITKGGTTAPDAGDVLRYTLTIVNGNTNTAIAYDINIEDKLPVGVQFLQMVAADSDLDSDPDVAGTGAAGDPQTLLWGHWQTVQLKIDLPADTTLTVVYEVVVRDDATPGLTFANTAAVDWTSLDCPCPYERTGSGVGANTYSAQDTSSTAGGFAYTVAKGIFATSFSGTSGDDLAIGETVTFDILVTFAEGTTPGAVLTDDLPVLPGILELLSATVLSIGGNNTPGATAGDNLSVTNLSVGASATINDNNPDSYDDQAVFDFGTVLNTGDNVTDDRDRILVRVVARMINLADNQSGETSTNTATLASGATSLASDTADVDTVEPTVAATKTAVNLTNPAPALTQPGDTIEYTVTLAASGGTAAYDIALVDALGPYLVYDGTFAPTVNGAGNTIAHATVTGGDGTPGNEQTLTWNLAGGTADIDIPAGDTVTVTYRAKVHAGFASAYAIVNDITVSWSSIDGGLGGNENGSAVERTGSGNAWNDYTDSDSSSLYTTFDLAKSRISASPAAIGETVTYRLVLAVTQGTTAGVTITDDLPADFSLVPGSVSVVNAPGLATGYVDEATSVATPAGQIVFTLGAVVCTNLAPNNTVTIQYQALVGNAAGNQDGAVKTNSATAEATGVPDSTDTAEVTIHEPLLVCSKTFENVTKCGPLTTKKLPAHRPQSNDVLRFTTTVTNTSATATAYDVNLLDMVGAAGGLWFDTGTLAVESATLNGAPWVGTTAPAIAGTLLTWGTGNGGDSSIDIAPGQTFEIVYRVTTNALANNAELTRSVVADWTSIDGADANERTGSGGLNDYTASFTHVLYSFNSTPTEYTVLGGDTATIDANGNLVNVVPPVPGGTLLGGERIILANGSALEVTGDGLPPAAQGYLNITLPDGASATIRQTGDFVVDHLILGAGATLRIIQGARGITIDYGVLDMGVGSTLIFPDDATVIFGPATIQGASGAANLATIRPTTKNGGLTLIFTCVTDIDYAHFAGIDDGYVNFQGPTAMDHAVFSGGDGTNPYVIYEYPAAVIWSNLAFRKEDGATTTIQNTQTDADTLYHVTVDGYLGPTELNYIGGNSTDIEPAGTTDDDPNSGVRWSNATPAYGVEATAEAPETGGVLVKWSAKVEIGVLKYLVQVSDGRAWTTLGEEFSRTEGIRGGSYEFLDRQALPGEIRRYRLLCVDVDGRSREHAGGEAAAVAEAPVAETLRATIPTFPPDGVASVRELRYDVQRHASGTPAVLGVARKATVARGGLYQRGDAGRILNLGRELPDLGGLVYIRPYTDPYTDANVVWDFAGPFETDGEPGEPPAPPAQGLLGPGGYFAVVHVEKDETLALNSMLPPGPNWFYGYANRLAPGNAPILVASVPAPAATGTAFLEVAVRSTTDGSHDLGATVNSVPVARAIWTGKGHHLVRFEFDLAACPLADGENRIQLWATTAGSSKRLDYLRVVAPATPVLRDGALVVDVLEGSDGTLHVPGATYAADITDFGRESLLGSRRGSFAGLRPGRKLHFADHAGTLDWSEPRDLAAVDRALAGREHVSVAPAAWLEVLEPLAAKRRDEGLDAAAVAWEDVRDAYGAGLPTPAGLVRLGRRLGPQYLLLAACATHDPKGLQGTLPPPGIPTGFVHVYEGTASTDDLYADGFAIAVGRLPARSRTELANMVHKIVDFQPGRRAVMIADVNDGGMSFGSFAQLQGELAEQLPSVLLDANTMNGPTLRAALVAAVNDGANLVTYQGHGNNALVGDRFDILNTTHAAQIPPSAWLFATCLTGIHTLEEEGTGVLASALLRTPGNGAVSVLASTCYGQAATEHRIAETAVRLTAAGGATWGGILLEVKRTLMPNETAAVYTLLGDPAMRTLSPVAGDREILIREPLAGTYLNAARPPEIRFALRGGWWRQTLEILWRRDHGEWTPLGRVQTDPEVFEYTVPWDPPPADGPGYQIMIREVAAEGGSN